MDGRIGQLVAARYRIESVLGSGGVGTVYRAVQEPLQRPVALKMLRPELAQDAAVRRMFLHEARAIASLSHPNIAMVFDFGPSEDKALYLALELVEGASLATLVPRDLPSFPVLRDIFDQLLAGLSHAHARGVVHRDIKPANVLVGSDEDGHPIVKVVDFGIATAGGLDAQGDVEGPAGVVGTPHFMAPEQARGERHLTAAVDVYTVGLMLFWAVTGRHAFDGDSPQTIMRAQAEAPIPRVVPRVGLAVPSGLEALIQDALRKAPADRIPTAAVFRARLRAVSGDVTEAAATAVSRSPLSAGPVRVTRPHTMLETRPPTLREGTILGERDVDEAVANATTDPAASGRPRPAAPRGSENPHGTARPSMPSLVGRQDDRQRLLDASLRALGDERGLVLTLEGEAGMGKSTLARWLHDRLGETRQMLVGQGAFHREGERGLRGFREAFDTLLDVRGLDATRVRAALTERQAALGLQGPADLDRLTSFLRPSLGDAAGGQEAIGRLESLRALLLRVLEALSATRPVLLWVDDLHWAGAEAASLLDYLAGEFQHRTCRVLVLVTIQIEDVENEAIDQMLRQVGRYAGSSVLRHELQHFSNDDARQLLQTMIPASPALAEALVVRAAGNPMHLVQLVRYVVDEQLVEPGVGGWRPRAGVDVAAVIPPSLADTLLVRIDQVEKQSPFGSRLRDVLDRAAIIGRSFRFRVLERMLQAEDRADLLAQLDEILDALVEEELLHSDPTRDDDMLSFPTALIRDVLLAPLRGRRTTRRLDLHAAEAKIAVLGAHVDRMAGDLAAHFAAARDRVRELQYTRLAADVAERTNRPNEAVRYLDHALTLVQELDDADDAAAARQMRLRVARIRTGLGDYADARSAFEQVLADVGATPVQQVEARYGIADVAWITGAFDDAAVALDAAIRIAHGLEDPALLSRGYVNLARVEWHRGRMQKAETLAGQAYWFAQSAGNSEDIAETTWFLGDLARARGDVVEAEQRFKQALERYRALDLPRGIAKSESKLAVTARQRGDFDRAVEHYQVALDLYRAHGGRRGMAHQYNGLGDIARYRGDLKLASEHYRRAVDIFQGLALPQDAATALTNLGLAALADGRVLEAEDALRRALRVSERIGFAYLSVGAGLNLALALARLHRDDEVDPILTPALALLDQIALVDPDFAGPLEQLGRWCLVQQRPQGNALLTRAAAMWRELGRTDDEARARATVEEA